MLQVRGVGPGVEQAELFEPTRLAVRRLRAAASLARLWQSQNKTKEAHDLLAPVCDWFTEGFDTADLKDAKGLLEEPK